MSDVEKYFENIEGPQKQELLRVHALIKKEVPEATEGIGYGMPVFKLNGKYVVGIAAFKNHMSLFPGSEPVAEFKDELGDHFQSKGTIQFTVDDPLSDEVVKKIVAACVERAKA